MKPNLAIETTSMHPEQMEAMLQVRLGNRVRDLRISMAGEGIILRGRTDTYHVKQLAQHAVMELCELPLVSNDIEVC